jgi:hypothetical protein
VTAVTERRRRNSNAQPVVTVTYGTIITASVIVATLLPPKRIISNAPLTHGIIARDLSSNSVVR